MKPVREAVRLALQAGRKSRSGKTAGTCKELLGHEKWLWTFVDTEGVQPTNNEAERTLRNPAEARKTGRASKTLVGARRQTIVVSVLESLRVYLPKYTLGSVMAEINNWWQAGQSCFGKLLKKMKLKQPSQAILDKVLPIPDGSG